MDSRFRGRVKDNTFKGSLVEAEEADATGVSLVLVVDDSAAQRVALRRMLERMGYRVVEAECGSEALEIADSQPVDLVLSDWMMPGMDGIELCRAFRALDRDDYGYFILLTAKSDRADVRQAFETGADDFLPKPVDSGELRARINAGERIVRMQRDLARKNRLLTKVVGELQTLYAALDRDLDEARALQQSLVPERSFRFPDADITLLFRPAGQVGGDLVGAIPLSDSRVGLYAIDVSGHGIASALMTARIAGLLSGVSPERNLALERKDDGTVGLRRPDSICRQINDHLIEEMETELYLTAMMADCDLATGRVTLTQAGHPAAIIMGKNGEMRFAGEGGMPLGLLPGPSFDTFEFTLAPGERLLILSDGLSECPGASGGFLEPEGLAKLAAQSSSLKGAEFFEALMWDVYRFAGGTVLDDDVSGVMVEYRPANGSTA